MDQARNEIGRIACIDEGQLEILISSGFQSASEVADTDLAEIVAILELDEETAQQVIDDADATVTALIMEEAERRNSPAEELPEEPEFVASEELPVVDEEDELPAEPDEE